MADYCYTPPPESRDWSLPVSVYSPSVILNEMTKRYRPKAVIHKNHQPTLLLIILAIVG